MEDDPSLGKMQILCVDDHSLDVLNRLLRSKGVAEVQTGRVKV